ncbi:hypothetical protein DENSPDRAFT_830644 [Dentipellis sp. KUC8613]|nr:hypothetical protein DENSPDRAFT_830644 [Dentipellis sp. KUC8613]
MHTYTRHSRPLSFLLISPFSPILKGGHCRTARLPHTCSAAHYLPFSLSGIADLASIGSEARRRPRPESLRCECHITADSKSRRGRPPASRVSRLPPGGPVVERTLSEEAIGL